MPRDPRMGKARSGPKEKAAGRTIARARNASRCKLCGLGEDILPTPNTVPDAPLDRRLIASRHLQPRTRIAVQPLSQSLCGRPPRQAWEAQVERFQALLDWGGHERDRRS